jgi:DNA-binding transcriptional LysR family regulator
VFSAFLHRYAERRPNVQVKLIEAVGPSLLDKLERGDVHLSICLMQTIQTDDHPFDSYPLPPMEFFAASHTSLALGTGRNIDIAKLAPYPLLLLDSSSVIRGTFNAACRLAGLKPNIFVESRSPQALLALAEAGHGVAIVPSVLPTHRYRLRVARIMHRRRPLREPWAALWDKRRALPPHARDFCEFLAAHIREVSPLLQPNKSKRGDSTKRATVRRT